MGNEKETIHIPDFRKAIIQVGGGTIFMVAVFFWAVSGWIRTWHFDTFPSRTEFIQALAEIKTNEQTVQALTLELRLGNAISRVDTLKSSIFLAEQQAKNFGTSAEMDRDRAELLRALERAEAYRNCLINSRPNCELLRFQGQ